MDAKSRVEADPEPRISVDSISSVSTTSLVFERLNEHDVVRGSTTSRRKPPSTSRLPYADFEDLDDEDPLKESDSNDLETGPFLAGGAVVQQRGLDRGFRRLVIVVGTILVAGWMIALFIFVSNKAYKHQSQLDHDPTGAQRGSGRQVTLSQVMEGFWLPTEQAISWIAGANGEDGLLLEQGALGKAYLVVEDVRADKTGRVNGGASPAIAKSRTLIANSTVLFNGRVVRPESVWPSPDLKKVLIASRMESNWRHSFTAVYYVVDVATQTTEALDPNDSESRIQLASWSPQSDAIVFTRDNNMFLRRLSDKKVIPITRDGGPEYFYGVPDWVYEEEVFSGRSATWWSDDGKYVAFLRTNESGVPEYPVQYFVSRPSGKQPAKGEENYPEVRRIKYPKAGSHNPVVDLQFYDVTGGDVFSVDISGGFVDSDRLVTEVLWCNGTVLVKETNRISDVMRVVLVDVAARTGRTVNTIDLGKIDGGWFEISHKTRCIPADPSNGRPDDGYVDTIVHDNWDHLAYFTPLDNPNPIMLTSGNWEVVDAPSSVDLRNNRVYFVATKESSIQRHVYSVKLDGTDLRPMTDTSKDGYYGVSFSAGSGFGLLTYSGPNIPWQKVVSTPSNPASYERSVEKNEQLADRAKKHSLPIVVYGTVNVDGVELNYRESRPPHFDESKKYPVIFYQYSGPGSQEVKKKFNVDFQAFMAANLGYVVVTVDPRGTGFIGRSNRVLVREKLGTWESHDQIAAGKIWAAKKYVDAERLAIWGWSYGGFMTLKTLEQDGGRTFKYGMAVAPVTDWRFYDSIYTERYMKTPQINPGGYEQSAINNVSALALNVRFLIMHGVADDNVHFQNSLTLLDKLDIPGIENYDVHVFPDSDHSILFHNANRIVYDKLKNWLVNAFNGEWIKINDAKPNPIKK